MATPLSSALAQDHSGDWQAAIGALHDVQVGQDAEADPVVQTLNFAAGSGDAAINSHGSGNSAEARTRSVLQRLTMLYTLWPQQCPAALADILEDWGREQAKTPSWTHAIAVLYQRLMTMIRPPAPSARPAPPASAEDERERARRRVMTTSLTDHKTDDHMSFSQPVMPVSVSRTATTAASAPSSQSAPTRILPQGGPTVRPPLPAPEATEPPSLDYLPELLAKALMPFQRTGVQFGIMQQGRCMIADEMGLGKTVQGISIALRFESMWPLLIVVPASMKLPWGAELERWVPSLAGSVKIVNKRNDVAGIESARVVIIAYSMFSSSSEAATAVAARRFRIAIADESHCLKSISSQRTKMLTPILHRCTHVILLSGTPALSRPAELYSQLEILQPRQWGTYYDFTTRYCNGHKGRFGWEVSGASNVQELHDRLKNVCIRRLKKDVLTQLPAKMRQRIPLELPVTLVRQLGRTMAKLQEVRGLLQRVSGDTNFDEDQAYDEAQDLLNEQRRLLNEAWQEVGAAKIDPAVAFVVEALETADKLLVFAHHKQVLDGMQDGMVANKIEFVRIDGQTPSAVRFANVQRFQEDPAVKVAILSMTAAGQGLTMTAASLVVFAELHWTPGVLAQCEDRAHRIGQRSCVTVQYLLAPGSLDDVLWGAIDRKIGIVSSALDGFTDHLKATTAKVHEDSNSAADSHGDHAARHPLLHLSAVSKAAKFSVSSANGMLFYHGPEPGSVPTNCNISAVGDHDHDIDELQWLSGEHKLGLKAFRHYWKLLHSTNQAELADHAMTTAQGGFCQLCGCDTFTQYYRAMSLAPSERRPYLESLNLLTPANVQSGIVESPKMGHFWQAELSTTTTQAGAASNYRTLCTACYEKEQAIVKKQKTAVMAAVTSAGTTTKSSSGLDIRSFFSSQK